MEGIWVKLLSALLLAVANSAELNSKMGTNKMIDLYAKNYFIQTWPSDVRNFVVGLINNSNNLTGSGIFYRRDVIMINADCLDTFLEKTPHAKHKISEGIAVVQAPVPIIETEPSELDKPRELFYFEELPFKAPLYAIQYVPGKEVNMVSYNLLWEMNGFLYAQFKQSFEDDYVSLKGDPLFYKSKLVGIFVEHPTHMGCNVAKYKRIPEDDLWFTEL